MAAQVGAAAAQVGVAAQVSWAGAHRHARALLGVLGGRRTSVRRTVASAALRLSIRIHHAWKCNGVATLWLRTWGFKEGKHGTRVGQ